MVIILLPLLLLAGCRGRNVDGGDGVTAVPFETLPAEAKLLATPAPTPEPEPEKPYPGRTVDQLFPVLARHDFGEESLVNKTFSVPADGLTVNVYNFTPLTISRHRQKLFDFGNRRDTENSSSNLLVRSHLLGRGATEIYAARTTGAICCTDSWIVNTTKGQPRLVFRSLDYGYFYEPFEVFDADGDGVYEIAGYDHAFRYVASLLGGSSPWPQAVFKYDPRVGRYLPAPELQQNFARENREENRRWLIDAARKLKADPTVTLKYGFRESVIGYVVDLFYLRRDREAWSFLNRYYPRDDRPDDPRSIRSVRADLRDRIRQSKYLQAIRRSEISPSRSTR